MFLSASAQHPGSFNELGTFIAVSSWKSMNCYAHFVHQQTHLRPLAEVQTVSHLQGVCRHCFALTMRAWRLGAAPVNNFLPRPSACFRGGPQKMRIATGQPGGNSRKGDLTRPDQAAGASAAALAVLALRAALVVASFRLIRRSRRLRFSALLYCAPIVVFTLIRQSVCLVGV
jgi:hypothetical protein